MKLIIDIDENLFTRLFDNGTEGYAIINDDLFVIAKAIRKSIPLDKIKAEIQENIEAYRMADWDTNNILADGLQMALNIIDKYGGDRE